MTIAKQERPYAESPTGRLVFSLAAAALLLIMFALAVTSMVGRSPTFDEQGFIVRGLGYARSVNDHMRVGHPLGLNLLNAALLVNDPWVRLPTDDASWQETSFHRPAELFLWEIGNNVEHIMFVARLPTVWLALLMAAVVTRWTRELVGSREWGVGSEWRTVAGLVALALVALDPNILAHAGLATTDLGLAAAATVAGYSLWRFIRRPTVWTAALAGIGMGLLQNTKFTALLFVPLFVAVIGLWVWQRSRGAEEQRGRGLETGRLGDWGDGGKSVIRNSVVHNAQSVIGWLLVYGLTALLALWATNGFQVGRLPEELPLLSQLAGTTTPLSHYLEQLLDIGGRLQVSTPSFLAGQYSDRGWWYYFPVAFLLKTPLPTLFLLLLAIGLLLYRWKVLGRNGRWLDLVVLLIPPLGYFAIALTSEINLGYRHLLPILPFLFVFIEFVVTTSVVGGHSRRGMRLAADQSVTTNRRVNGRWLPGLVGLCLLGLALTTLRSSPHLLAFFNVLAGGPERGWRWLVDSNIDWGQDLGALKAWMDDNEVDHIWLSYFGEGWPEYYGIEYTGLDSFPPRLMNPAARPFYPHDPAPGTYAISVTNLQGVHFANHNQFAWFRQRQPIAHVGHSILIYEVAERGRPADLLLSGVQLDQLAAADFALLETNQVTPHWFDAAQSWLLPGSDTVWLALGEEQTIHPILESELNLEAAAAEDGYTLYRVGATTEGINAWIEWPPIQSAHQPLAVFLGQEGGQIELLGYTILNEEVANQFSLLTTWRQTAEPRPVQIFLHLLRPNGEIVAQYDGLGAAWEGWRPGDVLVQLHQLSLPADLPPDDYTLTAGLYDPQTLVRWTADEQDVVVLEPIKLPVASDEE